MQKVHQTRDVVYSPEEMYALVADIERYPEFLPWCVGARIRKRGQEGDKEVVTADVIVAYTVFRERFTSRVTLDAERCTIDVAYVQGPFRNLTTKWFFERQPEGGCRIHFDMEFEFRSLALQALINAVFGKAFTKLMQAFIDRADALHAKAALGVE
jgi:coenzyme Q-binding protein COQ10